MEAQAVCTVKDVDQSTKELLQRLFGRALPADQKVMLTLLDVAEFPSIDHREEAWVTINRILDQAAEHMMDLSEQEFNDAADEAMKTVRPSYERPS